MVSSIPFDLFRLGRENNGCGQEVSDSLKEEDLFR